MIRDRRSGLFPGPDFRITIVTAYEVLGGAQDFIRKLRAQNKDPIPGFRLFQELIDYVVAWQARILGYDLTADQVYRGFPRRQRQPRLPG